jgi:hypothetical protein
MLPGYALAAAEAQVHIAAWPGREHKQAPQFTSAAVEQTTAALASVCIAGACYVVLVGGVRLEEHTPTRFRDLVG